MAAKALGCAVSPSKDDDWRKRPRKHFVDPAWLRQVYEVERRQVGEIAAEIGCSINHLNWMVEKYGIPRRDGRLGRVLPTRRASFDLDRAIWLYEVDRMNCNDIGLELGVHGDTVRRRMREAGVRIRHQNDTKRGAKSNNRIELNARKVANHYLKKNEGLHSTAAKFGVSAGVIARVLDEMRVPRKPFDQIREMPTGPDHPSWKSELSPHERAIRRDHNRQKSWRERVFERDGYCCQRCRDDKGGNLNAHHIVAHNEDKKLRWVLDNGITLCVRCHREFHRRYGMNGFGRRDLDEYLATAVPALS